MGSAVQLLNHGGWPPPPTAPDLTSVTVCDRKSSVRLSCSISRFTASVTPSPQDSFRAVQRCSMFSTRWDTIARRSRCKSTATFSQLGTGTRWINLTYSQPRGNTMPRRPDEQQRCFKLTRTDPRLTLTRRGSGGRSLSNRFSKWSRRESNPRPLECDSSALPAELRPHTKGSWGMSVRKGTPDVV